MAKEFKANCIKHGLTIFVLASPGTNAERKRCKKCRTEAVQRRRHRVKEKAVSYLGGKCYKCGYNKCIAALDFHHRDPNEKEFGIGGKGFTRAWRKIKKELDKCDLICSNCHRELHFLQTKVIKRKNIKPCLICSTKFDAGNYNKMKYCSAKCRAVARNKQTKIRRQKTKEKVD